METTFLKTPIGTAQIEGNGDGVARISVCDHVVDESIPTPECLLVAVQQLTEYFNNGRTEFTFALNPAGTAFQQHVWTALRDIPYGETTSYMAQAKILGDVKAIRAVATANGKNPLWIVVPCHRVIGSNGALTGYAGGLWRKKWLLEHENPSLQQSLF